ncbi:MAG TPA: tetratricopeptide repeat protein [Thermoanaerobaculia bacterium]|nr:tetratricopeptide repeat protein [Thermoanaerobaculia bacterium]
MRPSRPRRPGIPLLLVIALAILAAAPSSATCGGGGGGGQGGFSESSAMSPGEPRVYRVPWKVIATGGETPAGALILYWFPTGPEEARASSLFTSRRLTVWSGECVGMGLVTADNADLRTRFKAVEGAPSAVLAAADGSELTRVESSGGKLDTGAVEKAVSAALEAREDAAKAALDAAKGKEKAGDADAAAALYTQVLGERCLFPSLAKKAAKALKAMGRPVPEETSSLWEGPAPDLSDAMNARMAAVMESGLDAEELGRIEQAQQAYERARDMDPGDWVPLRFLGELHRHHTGDWGKATAIFESLLARPADPLTRAVAMHGLGKMTIHAGDFAAGLALFERSLKEFPLALTYRNLAVYWASERQPQKAYGYVEKALALAPNEVYNLIFAATQYVAMGRAAEAEALAKKHEDMLQASYNLAAIHAQLGHRDEALELLRRHFFVYEQFDAVRRMEMQEARDDVVFASLHQDPTFVALTALADGKGGAMRGRQHSGER